MDVFFTIGIVLSAVLWGLGAPTSFVAWPQPLLFLFLSIAAVVTTIEAGSQRFFSITAYLAVVALALASSLRRDPRRLQAIEVALVVAGIVTAATVAAGAWARQLGIPFFHIFAYDFLRGEGLFKDPNVAGGFIACTYPLAAARALRFRRGRVLLLVIVTAIFTAGVVFSYSRWALILQALGVVGTIVLLGFTRNLRPLFALVAVGVIAIVIGHQTLPSFRYQALQGYDEVGRLAAWRLALELTLERPLGTGSGSFERLAVERYGPGSGWTSTDAPVPADAVTSAAITGSANLVRNGAFDGGTNWYLEDFAAAIDDPTSPTGHALLKQTTAIYQDPGALIPVVPGATYSFAATIKTDGTPALLIVHWRDASDATISQAHSEIVSATTWTETQLSEQVAPPDAKAAVLLLSNLEPGNQYFTAIRAVAGPVAPPWSDDLQHVDKSEAGARPNVPVPQSTHNTFLRLMVENGVPGLVTISAYWLTLAWFLWKMGRRSSHWALAFTLIVVAGSTIWVYTAVAAAAFATSPLVARQKVVVERVPGRPSLAS